eukprot:2313759-Rhodomonas_salina.1
MKGRSRGKVVQGQGVGLGGKRNRLGRLYEDYIGKKNSDECKASLAKLIRSEKGLQLKIERERELMETEMGALVEQRKQTEQFLKDQILMCDTIGIELQKHTEIVLQKLDEQKNALNSEIENLANESWDGAVPSEKICSGIKSLHSQLNLMENAFVERMGRFERKDKQSVSSIDGERRALRKVDVQLRKRSGTVVSMEAEMELKNDKKQQFSARLEYLNGALECADVGVSEKRVRDGAWAGSGEGSRLEKVEAELMRGSMDREVLPPATSSAAAGGSTSTSSSSGRGVATTPVPVTPVAVMGGKPSSSGGKIGTWKPDVHVREENEDEEEEEDEVEDEDEDEDENVQFRGWEKEAIVEASEE